MTSTMKYHCALDVYFSSKEWPNIILCYINKKYEARQSSGMWHHTIWWIAYQQFRVTFYLIFRVEYNKSCKKDGTWYREEGKEPGLQMSQWEMVTLKRPVLSVGKHGQELRRKRGSSLFYPEDEGGRFPWNTLVSIYRTTWHLIPLTIVRISDLTIWGKPGNVRLYGNWNYSYSFHMNSMP